MNIALMVRNQLQAGGQLGAAVLRNFESLIAALTSWGDAEHNDDGTHSAITASSAVVDVVSKGRYRNHKIAIWDNNIATDGIIKGSSHYQIGSDPPIAFQDAGVIVVVNTNGAAAGVPTIYAMDSVGRENGEIVWLLYCNGNTGGLLAANMVTNATAAESKGYTEFVEDPAVRNVRGFAQGRIVPVMLFDVRATGFFPGNANPKWYLGAGIA